MVASENGIDCIWLSVQYGREFTDLELVVGGVNRTYRVRGGAEVFYLRLYRATGRPLSEIKAEAQLLACFPQSPDVDVSRPIATISGDYIIETTWNGEQRNACLFRNAGDDTIEFNASHMRRFGASIAQLHLAMPASVGGRVRCLDPVGIVEDALIALRAVPQSEELIDVIQNDYLQSLLRANLSELPAGLCHGDAWTGNARFLRNKTVFFDFDEFGYAPFVLDLSTAAWHFMRGKSPRNLSMMQALVAGYETVRILSLAERNALPIFIKLEEVRSLLFLARYCILSEDMWSDMFGEARRALATQ